MGVLCPVAARVRRPASGPFQCRHQPSHHLHRPAHPGLLPVFGALRLARFNVDTNQATTFTGLPIPANAIFWIGFTDWYYHQQDCPVWIVVLLIVVMSLLMVCNLRMFSLKMHNLSSLKENWAQYLQVVATVALIVLTGLPGLAAAIMLYVLLSIIKREK